MQIARIAIVGAGLGGLYAACILARQACHVSILCQQ
jgi:phytoene dehydrogenase-like protein